MCWALTIETGVDIFMSKSSLHALPTPETSTLHCPASLWPSTDTLDVLRCALYNCWVLSTSTPLSPTPLHPAPGTQHPDSAGTAGSSAAPPLACGAAAPLHSPRLFHSHLTNVCSCPLSPLLWLLKVYSFVFVFITCLFLEDFIKL